MGTRKSFAPAAKQTKQETGNFAAPTSSSLFQSRPFTVQKQSEENSNPEDIKTSLMRAHRYGHNLSRIVYNSSPKQISPIQPKPVIQRELTNRFDNEDERMGSVENQMFPGHGATHQGRKAQQSLNDKRNETKVKGGNNNGDVAMTYHHVIPRNKLATFWDLLISHRDLTGFKPAMEKLTEKAIERVNAHNRVAGENRVTGLEAGGETQNKVDLMNYFDRLANNETGEDARNNSEMYDVIKQIYQWWPANIHQGPTNRVQGGETGDGGNDFEKSAKHLLASERYTNLETINKQMEAYEAEANQKKRREYLKKIVNRIQILSAQTDITKFDSNKWEQAKDGLWKVKPTS